MYRKASSILFMSLMSSFYGCHLDKAPELGDFCDNAKYYMNSSGEQKGDFTASGDPYFAHYQEFGACPVDYPVCGSDAEGVAFCHEECRSNEIFCKDGCIKPLADEDFCGAKGMCTDLSPDSKNYRGDVCARGEICDNGRCRIDCPLGSHEKGNTCTMDDNDHCGSENVKCGSNEICSMGKCAANCSSSEAKCKYSGGTICAIPETNTMFCGAKLEDCSGYTKCSESQKCEEGHCVCIDGYHPYNGGCELNDDNNCGGHEQLCDKSRVEHSQSVKCSTDGICKPIYCESGYCPDGYSCVDSQTDVNNCGSCGYKCYYNTGATGVKCEESKCKMTGCSTGYYFDSTYNTCLLKVKDCGDKLCDMNSACGSSICVDRNSLTVCSGTSGMIYCVSPLHCSNLNLYYQACFYWP